MKQHDLFDDESFLAGLGGKLMKQNETGSIPQKVALADWKKSQNQWKLWAKINFNFSFQIHIPNNLAAASSNLMKAYYRRRLLPTGKKGFYEKRYEPEWILIWIIKVMYPMI